MIAGILDSGLDFVAPHANKFTLHILAVPEMAGDSREGISSMNLVSSFAYPGF
jgi:hypothetical protein